MRGIEREGEKRGEIRAFSIQPSNYVNCPAPRPAGRGFGDVLSAADSGAGLCGELNGETAELARQTEQPKARSVGGNAHTPRFLAYRGHPAVPNPTDCAGPFMPRPASTILLRPLRPPRQRRRGIIFREHCAAQRSGFGIAFGRSIAPGTRRDAAVCLLYTSPSPRD